MRAIISILFLLAFVLGAAAQDGDQPAEPPEAGKEGAEKPKAPVEPPAWKLPDRDRKKLASLIEDYIHPRRTRQDALAKVQKFVDKKIDGHSALEDVAALVEIANGQREFNKRWGKKGKVVEVGVRPEWHGFPGGIGTVQYHLYLPKKYDTRRLWPVIYCLPDNDDWPDGKKYIEEMWIKRSAAVAENYVIVVPKPQAKGDRWTKEKSMARAMITLRHVLGTFDATSKNGGPASDMLRVFIDGSEAAAVIAARFPEMFAGAILHGADGKQSGSPDLGKGAGLHGVPAFLIYDGKKKRQRRFATHLKSQNDATLFVEGDDKLLGDAKAVADWMAKLPARNTQPRALDYTVYDGSFQRCYWVTVLEFDASVKPSPAIRATADRAKNEVRVAPDGVTRCELFLNDAIVDLNREIRIVVEVDEKEVEVFKGIRQRDLGVMLEELVVSNHPWRVYPSMFIIDMAQVRSMLAAQEAAAAKKKAEEEAKKGDAPKENSGAEKPMQGK